MTSLAQGTEVQDHIHGVRYRLEQHLGSGGFGTAYRATRLDAGGRDGTRTCLKITTHEDEWHAELYFANLLRGSGHVVETLAAFPTRQLVRDEPRWVYAIEKQWAEHGSVEDLLAADPTPWDAEQVRKRVKALLKPVALLHAMSVGHRNLTPHNVFVGPRKNLKLGDFGITRSRLRADTQRATAPNLEFAPEDLGTGWTPADDVYEIGLLMATLVSGRIQDRTLGKGDVNGLTSHGPLREAIKAAIGVRGMRPQNATDLMKLL